MARNVRASSLETRTARLRLPVARKPSFVRIGPGVSLGYRRNVTAGTWVVRVSDGGGGSWTQAIGSADDHEAADGATTLDYWQAQDRARQVAKAGKTAASKAPAPCPGSDAADAATTVEAAIAMYERDLRTRGGDPGNASRARRHISLDMLAKPAASLTARELRTWRDSLTMKRRKRKGDTCHDKPGRPLAAAGVNRLCAALKAALNLAADMDAGIASRRPWEQGLATLPGAEQARNVILADADVRKLVKLAPAQGGDFALLMEALAMTGARVSQLAACDVADLIDDGPAPRIMMPASAKGRGRKTMMRRPVPISLDFATRLRKAAEGRHASDPLFPKGAGRWKDTDHARPFAATVAAAGIKTESGDPVTSYALRHSSIVRMLLANVPVRVVATQHDTSVAMIERNYSRFIADHADAIARAGLLTIIDIAA